MKTSYWLLALLLVLVVGVQIGMYQQRKHPRIITAAYVSNKSSFDAGYSQGWSDAHCGPGNSCEAGDE